MVRQIKVKYAKRSGRRERERENERKKERKRICVRERGGEWLRLNINREDVKSWETFKYSFFDFSPN